MWGNWHSAGFAGWAVMIVFWVAVVVLILLAIRAAGSKAPPPSVQTDALGILERRYAAGEIDRQEFEERRRVLRSAHADPPQE